MKKLYTMLLAAVVALSATAAMPFKAERAIKSVGDVQFEVSNKKLDKKIDIKKLGIDEDRLLTIPTSRAEEYPSFDRDYFLMFLRDTTQTYYNASPCHLYEDPDYPEAGLYFLDQFIYSDADQIECEFRFEQISDELSVPVLTIKGDGATPLYTSGGSTYSLYLFGYNTNGKPVVYEDDIEFVLLNDGTLVFYWTGIDIGIAYVTPQLRGGWILAPSMVVPNGTFDSTVADDYDTETEQLVGGAVNCKVYSEYYEDENVLMLANFCDYGRTTVFAVYPKEMVAMAPAQPVVTLGNSSVSFDGILAGDYDENGVTDYATAAIEVADGKTTLTIPECYVIVMPNEAIGLENPSWFNILFDTEIVLDYELPIGDNSGIANVEVDANAPVEYYNLQGVHVANPEAGLYIKRQGNKATKVFVK